MTEKAKADIYLLYLDQILAGEEHIIPVENVEIEEVLQLAKTLIAADYSVNSRIKEPLKKKLLAQEIKKSNLSMQLRNNGELDEDSLDLVAGGQSGVQRNICPHCGSSLTILDGKCIVCNH